VPIEYSNPLVSIHEGLKQALLEREERARRMEADQMARDREARLKAHDEAQLEVSRANLKRQQEEAQSLADTRATTRAKQISETLVPGVVLDDDTTKVLRAGGMGALIDDQSDSVKAILQDIDMEGNPIGEATEQAAGPVNYRGTVEQQEEAKQMAVFQKLLDDPSTPEDVKLAAQFALGGKTVPTELIKTPEKTVTLRTDAKRRVVERLNDATGQWEPYRGLQPGEKPHWLQEQMPPATVIAGNSASTDAIDVMAWQWLQTGQPPTRNPSLLNRVATRVSQLQEQYDLPDPAAAGADFAADRSSLSQTTRNLDAIKAYEGMARRNIETLKTTLPKLVDTGLPILNAPVRKFMQMTGSPQVASFQTALRPVQTELGRILGGSSTLSGVVSVHAQKEIEELLRGDYNVEQFMAALDILDRDMRARETELSRQQRDIQGRLRSRGSQGRDSVPGVVAPRAGGPGPAAGGAPNDPMNIRGR
jgi:hypothetical protein